MFISLFFDSFFIETLFETLFSMKFLLLVVFFCYLKGILNQIQGYISFGTLTITFPTLDLFKKTFFFKNHTQTQFKLLSDICGLHSLNKKINFFIYYQLLSIVFNARLAIKLALKKMDFIPSLITIFSCANWFEREIWDLLGIFFLGNTDLRRILSDYGFKGHPLRKDFPLSGFFEQSYSHSEKRMLEYEVSLSQELRSFFFTNSQISNDVQIL